jgi:hypothetical protein
MNLGEVIGAALMERAAPDDSLETFATTDLIASHYGLHPDEVLEVVVTIASEQLQRGGSLCRILETRHGFGLLGVMVAQRLLGSDEIEAVPLITPSLH